jgi:hypothetical protein
MTEMVITSTTITASRIGESRRGGRRGCKHCHPAGVEEVSMEAEEAGTGRDGARHRNGATAQA